jgi:hypothetical protein
MKTRLGSPRVKPDRAAENDELARAVYDELLRARPAGTPKGRGRS